MSGTTLKAKKIVIIGGCGHVGLPLGVKFALAGANTVLVDINQQTVDAINQGSFPFVEHDGEKQLRQALRSYYIKQAVHTRGTLPFEW